MIEKEIRALLPLWLAIAAAMMLAHASGRSYGFLGGFAFLIGAATLGAHAFGHEYSYGTVGAVLTLPVPRSRIWLTKLGVLVLSLTALTAVALYTEPFGAMRLTTRVYLLTGAAAVGFAPFLAMVSRTTLGGAVFTASIAGMLFLASQIIGVKLYGFTREVDHFTVTFMTADVLVLSVVGLALGWRTFAGLEALEGRGAEVALPFFRASSAVSRRRRSHPIGQLVMKELRLQQLTWVMAAIFVALYVSVVLFSQDRSRGDNVITLMIVLYTAIIGAMIGSLAGGEERQLGVHDAQLLLPMSSRRMWTVKVVTSLGLGVILTIVLPLILLAILPPERLPEFGRRGTPSLLMLLTTLMTLGLYVSVVAGSGLRGLIASIPVGTAVFSLLLRFILPQAFRISRWMKEVPRVPRNAEPYVFALLFGLFLVVVLRLALTNYRWPDRSPARLARHAVITLTALTACFTLLAALGIR